MKQHLNIIKLVTSLLLISIACNATNYYIDNSVSVDGNGSIDHPWKSIQTGINKLGPDDILNIRGEVWGEGRVYSQNTPLDFSACQSGSSTAIIIVQAYPGEKVMIRNEASGFLINMKFWEGKCWTFKNILFDQNSAIEDCIRIGSIENSKKPANITFSGCTVRNGQADGMDISLADNVLVENCKIYGVNGHGIALTNGRNNIFCNNEIYDCAGDCIQIITGNTEGTLIENNHLYTTLKDKSKNALNIKSNLGGTVIRSNKCHGFRTTLDSDGTAIVIYGFMPGILIEKNEVYDSEGGISINSTGSELPTNVLLRNNLVHNIINEHTAETNWLHYGEGIDIDGAIGVEIYNNTVYDIYGYSLVCGITKSVNNLVVKNNIFNYGYAATFTTNVTNTEISHNGFFNLYEGIPLQATSSTFGTETGFVDPDNSDSPDFQLKSDSPCIDAGIDIGLPYVGNAPDLGAYEFGSISTVPIILGTPTEDAPDVDISLNGNFSINWKCLSNAWVTGYELQEMTAGSTWTTIASNISPQINSYDVRGRVIGNTYSYRVRAMDEDGQWGTFSASSDGIRVVSRAAQFPPAGIISDSDAVWVNMPDGCFTGTITLTISDVSPSTTQLDLADPAIGYILTTAKKLVAITDNNKTISPAGSLTLTLSYPEAGTDTEQGYRIYEWSDGKWQAIKSQIDTTSNTISATITALSSYIVAATALSNVSSLTATAGNNREVTVGWQFPLDSRVKDVTVLRKTSGYAIDHTDGVEVYRGTKTTTIDLEAFSGITYYYAAFTSDGEGRHSLATSSAQSMVTTVDTTPPGNIESFTATGKYGKIALSWKNPVDNDYLRTDIVHKTNGYPETITDGVMVYSGTGSSCEDVVKAVDYYYAAFAYDGINYSAPATTSAISISDITPPSPPGTPTENLISKESDIDISTDGVWLLRWDNAQSQDEESGIESYTIEERIDNGSWTRIQTFSGNNVTASFANKQSGHTYYYRLQATNKIGLTGSYSVSSDGIRVVDKATVLPATASMSIEKDKQFIVIDVPTNAYASSTIFGMSQITSPQTDLLQANPPIEKLLGNTWQLVAVDGNNNLLQPANSIMLIVSYPDPDDVLETEDMERYRLFALDEWTNAWKVVSGSQIIMGTNNMIQVAIGSISTFVVAKLRDTIPPEAIGNFTVTGGEYEVSLSWQNPVDADFISTIIVSRTDKFPGSSTDGSVVYLGTETGYIDGTVTDSTTYYYAGFSYDGTNYSTLTTGSTTVKDTTPPAGMGSFTATGKTGKVSLSWALPQDTDFGQVKILRSTIDFPATITGYTPIFVGTETSYTDTTVTNGLTYYYAGFTYDRVGNVGNVSHATATPSIDTPPSAPGTVTEGYFDMDVVISPGAWAVFWGTATSEGSGVSYYELQERVNDEGWKTIGNTTGDGNLIWWPYAFYGTVSNIYYYRVRAINESGMWGSYGTVSDGIRVVDSAKNVQYGKSLEWITVDDKGEKSGLSIDVSDEEIGTGAITISQKVVGNMPFNIIGKSYQVILINAENKEIQPQGSITLTLFYPDPDNGNEEADKGYRIYWLDNDGWKIVSGEQRVDPAGNQITVRLSHLSVYAVGIPINEIMVYPNPFNPGRYANHTKIIFKGWNGYAKIRIYKLNGELIEEMEGNDIKEWVPSSDIASGVYIYVIDVQDGQKSAGKLAIIR